MTLNEARVGKFYEVVEIKGSGSLKRRIMDMGITKKTKLYIRKVAPLGDPVQINLRDYELSIRGEDAKLIRVNELEGAK